MDALIITSLSIAVIHSLASHHYLPIAAIGKAKNWSAGKIVLIAAIVSAFHVSTSISLGLMLMRSVNFLGLAEVVENLSPLLLIAVGGAYALAAVSSHRKHLHSTSTLSLLLILGLSPCLPLIPVMLATDEGLTGVIASFAAATIATVAILTYLSSKSIKQPWLLHGKEDVVVGIIVAATDFYVSV